jgi:hypothetical protein
MNDKLIQEWLDGESSHQPPAAETATYERLYSALAEKPSAGLSAGFTDRLIKRIAESETESRKDRIVNGLALVAAAVGLVTLLIYSQQFVQIDYSPLVSWISLIAIPSGLISQTWLFSALVCLLIGVLDRYVAPHLVALRH